MMPQDSQNDRGADTCPRYRDSPIEEECPGDITDASTRERELTASLPRSLAAMAKIVPLDAVMKIAKRYGGMRIYVPRNPSPQSEIARLIGLRGARALCAKQGGGEIEIPRARAAFNEIRDAEIRLLRRRGASLPDLARRFGLVTRQVRRICNGKSDSKTGAK